MPDLNTDIQVRPGDGQPYPPDHRVHDNQYN